MDSLKELRVWSAVEDWINQGDVRVLWGLGAVLGTGTAGKLIHWLYTRHRLEQRRVAKRHQCEQSFNSLSIQLTEDNQVSPEQQAEILSLTFTELQSQLKAGRFTPVQVLQAFQHKALSVHREINCLEEPLLEAQATAEELERGDKTHLPLYGIPVSIKDGYGIKGYDCSIGVAKLAGIPLDEDCVIVKVLKEQGAVPFVRTNVPQTMFAYECSNPIFGVTSNPHDKSRGPGGSSGGEAALIASGGSVVGFGSDIAGSIRMPSAHCGICGLKPTQHRTSMKDMMKLLEGQTLIMGDFGPLAKEVDGLVEVLRALMSPSMFKLDPALPPVCFNEQMFGDRRRLKIGYYTFDGVFHTVPSCQRAVTETVTLLRNMGHEVVKWNMAQYGPRIMTLYYPALFGDGFKGYMELLKGEKIDYSIWFFNMLGSLNSTLVKLLTATVGKMYPNIGMLMKSATGVGSVSEYWNVGANSKTLQEEVYKDLQKEGIDILISPGFCSPAMPHGIPGKCPGTWSGTAVYNFLYCPAGSLPVSKVTKEDLSQMDGYPTPDPWHKLIKEAQKGSEGLPVSVQVASLPWHDELCLRVMKEIETALKH